MLIDCHCHLDEYTNLEEVIANMNGIVIVSGYDYSSNLLVLDLIQRYDNVYGTIGYHPDQVGVVRDIDLMLLEENVNNKKIVGIGEIGLDYHYTKDNILEQKALFIKQINIAIQNNKPIVVHSRDAIQDTYDIIEKNNYDKVYLHCFSGSLEMAKKFVKLGVYLGIGGVVTYNNASKLQEVVKGIELEHFLLETDSPYLTPVPFRGKKNEPKNVYFVANKIAELKNIDLEEVVKITNENAKRLFDLNF